MLDIVFTLDNTGSMSPSISELRRRLNETASRLFKEVPNLQLGIIIHEDYCDGSNLIRQMPLTNDTTKLLNFIDTIHAGGGGDAPEAYEYALYLANKQNWRLGADKVLVVVGDEVPHDKNYAVNREYSRLLPNDRKEGIDWLSELKQLKENGVTVYGVQALGYSHARSFYNKLAINGGVYLPLHQLNNIVELVTAITYNEINQLDVYQNELKESGKLNRSIAAILDALSGTKSKWNTTDADLDAVSPGRFQILHVDEKTSIKDFVTKTGATFRIGHGFYEFTKSEDIQEKKEVVLVHKISGDMYSGTKAREMIGLPYGERGHLRPAHLKDYDVFVQSTSINRILIPGTRFLYENEA